MDYRKQYEDKYGIVIPADYDIHHVDLNHDHNDMSNLLLLPHDLHMRLHRILHEGLVTHSAHILSFGDCQIAAMCSFSGTMLAEYAAIYNELHKWAAAKEFEDYRILGLRGPMPFNYNAFRNE